MFSSTADHPDPIAIPRSREAGLVERLLWVFLMSFALDYRAAASRESGAGLDQLLFLGLCTASTIAIAWLGRRFLTVRPGVWLLAFWGLFLAYMFGNSLLQGVPTGRSIRVALPLVFCFFGMANAHVASCVGIRPSRIVAPVFVAACVNVVWRILHGFLFQDVSLETVRFEVQSPAISWIAAWLGCAILLRGRFQWSVVAACAVLFIGIVITVTRSLILPVIAAALAGEFCFLLGVWWRQFEWSALWRRLLPVGAVVLLTVIALAAVAVVEPVLIERWNERLFHHAAARNLGADISYLTRMAEADAIWGILKEEPLRLIHGRGIGSSYYWDPAYLPEIWEVLPKEEMETEDIWFAGHSVWTYALLSGGAIALAAWLGLFGATAAYSLIAARANASDPGPDHWLAFLPFVATCCLISETLTTNPFQERLTGILFGMMAGLSQAFMVRSSWLHTAGRNPASDLT